MHTPESALEILKKGADILSEKELLKKLQSGRRLKVKLGVDPTAPDIHLGHTVGLQKLRQFQDLGHQAILIIGDVTAMIGDPSGRSATRPQLTHQEVLANAKSYQEQAFKVLDSENTQIVFNGEWFEKMSFQEVIKLTSRVTLQQMLQREDFRERMTKEQPIHAHEILYPIMQGWDSVMLESDVEIGGTDQMFNILVGRDLQKVEGQEQQVALMVPILEGLDGVQKMSKSLNNYVAVNEAAGEMFGKIMSISDELMPKYYLLLFAEDMVEGHPMELKKELARKVVERYHDAAAATAAIEDWNLRFSKRDLAAADLPEVSVAEAAEDIISIVVVAYALGYQQKRSRSDARRLVEQGSIQLDGEKITDVKAQPVFSAGQVLKLDKKRAVRICQ